MKFLILFVLFSSAIALYESDEWYRYVAMPVTAAAYRDDPSQCWSNIHKCTADYYNSTYSIYRQYNTKCESMNDTCSAYIAVETYTSTNDIVIFIAFRGTNNNYQVFENGWNYDEMVPFVAGGKVSKVFFDGFNALWNAGMKDDLNTLKNRYPNAIYYFLGHSLGGAMASLAAATFKKFNMRLDVDPVITFGQPRVGDKDFVDAFFHSLFLLSDRIVHKADIVPHLPLLNESVYYHEGNEMWYNNDMGVNNTYVMCKGFEDSDPKCSISLPNSDYNMEDHKYYYGRNFIEYGKSGCPDLGNC